MPRHMQQDHAAALPRQKASIHRDGLGSVSVGSQLCGPILCRKASLAWRCSSWQPNEGKLIDHKRPKNVMTLLVSRKPLERSWKLGSGLDCCGHAAAHVPPHHQRRLVHAVQTKLPNTSQRHIRNSRLSLLWLYIRASKHHGTTGALGKFDASDKKLSLEGTKVACGAWLPSGGQHCFN